MAHDYWKGKKFSTEHRHKLSLAKKGQPGWNTGMTGYTNAGSFKKGHKFIKGGEKGWFKKGQMPTNFKGIDKIDKDGYVLVYSPDHPYARDKYIRRGRLVMEAHIGRYLTPKEVVHHKGIKYPLGSIENKQDDRIENLTLFENNSEHQIFHHPKGIRFHKLHPLSDSSESTIIASINNGNGRS